MAKNKTTETNNSVMEYINAIADEKRSGDVSAIIDIMTKETGLEPKMWGTGIVGFGSYHYRYESGHEGDAPLAGLSSRTNAITLYLASGFEKREELLQKFGKHKRGKACIYIQKLEDINIDILKKLVSHSVDYMKRLYPA